MKRFGLMIACAAMLSAFAAPAFAQSNDEKDLPYVKRATLAVRYVENKKTTVNLTGTSLAPRVTGRVDVEYKKNDARIRLKVQNLDNPQTFGPFYTTFVVWAITPEGQAENLNELPSGYAAEIQAQTIAQTFGVIITAEPHSAVKMPSQKLVAETTLPKNATAGVQTTQAEYRADKGSFYETQEDSVLKADYTTPRLVLGARRSIDIARRAGAKEFSREEWRQAEEKLATLEQIWPRNLKSETKFSGLARDVMRLAQVARDLAIEREQQARIENERQERLRRLEEARAQAEAAKAEAERIKLEADRARAEAELAKAKAESAKAEAEKAERAAADERARREQAAREAEAARARVETERLAAERAKAEARQREEAARAETERARAETERAQKAAEEAKRERDAALQKLYVSLSEILDTKRETRGFIVNLGDVLFDTGKATLKPAAREKLSKLAGILLAYPGQLMLEIEGHTDSVGSDELNNKLSQSRAQSVNDYLTGAGVKSERVKAVKGFGKTKPIATNDTAAGRAMNRRVEVVIEDSEAQAKQQ
ncbi:MAG: Chromosome partition protein Smc [Acidobacteria bacterium]|nr:Chromosome partition protein Smc [Acidobacteriota bacterium]